MPGGRGVRSSAAGEGAALSAGAPPSASVDASAATGEPYGGAARPWSPSAPPAPGRAGSSRREPLDGVAASLRRAGPPGDEEPDGARALDRWRGGRWDPGRRGVAALALLAVLAAVLTAAVVLRGRPQPVAAPQLVDAGAPVAGGPEPAAGEPAAGPAGGATEVVVSVGGLVARPGLVRLPAGSRVADAVAAAGGSTDPAALAVLNLARRVVDGEQVWVGLDAPAGAAPAAGGAAPEGAPLDLNTATVALSETRVGSAAGALRECAQQPLAVDLPVGVVKHRLRDRSALQQSQGQPSVVSRLRPQSSALRAVVVEQ